jgi:site-specific DNA recombinase
MQYDRLNQFIKEQNWTPISSYVDTGAGSYKYKSLQTMVKDAQNNKYEVILATNLSRLFSHKESPIKLRELCEIGRIHIVALDGNINTLQGIDIIGPYAWMVEQESKIRSQRIKDSLRKQFLEKQCAR